MTVFIILSSSLLYDCIKSSLLTKAGNSGYEALEIHYIEENIHKNNDYTMMMYLKITVRVFLLSREITSSEFVLVFATFKESLTHSEN